MRFRLYPIFLTLALILAGSFPVHAQTFSGSKVQDGYGNLLTSGAVCLTPTSGSIGIAKCAVVSSGVFSISNITTGSYGLGVTGASGQPILNLGSITIPSTGLTFEAIQLVASSTNPSAWGLGDPYTQCVVGATYTRTDAPDPSQNGWQCALNSGYTIWIQAGAGNTPAVTGSVTPAQVQQMITAALSGVVQTVNSQTGPVTVQGAGGTTVQTSGNTVTITSPTAGGVTSVSAAGTSGIVASVTNPNSTANIAVTVDAIHHLPTLGEVSLWNSAPYSAAAVAAMIQHQTGCSTGGTAWNPATNTCSASSGGGASLPASSNSVIYTDTTGVARAASGVTTDGGNLTVGGAVFLMSNGGGTQIWNNALRATNEKAWDVLNYDSNLHFRVRSDDGTIGNDWLTVNRSALQPTQANFAEPIVTTGSLSSTTSTVNLHDAMPGFNLGANMGLGGGWYGQSSYLATFISESQGMHNGLSSSDFECKGGGDCNPFGFYAHSTGAATRPADEGMTTGRLAAFVGESNFKATITSGGANATQLNFNAIGGSKGVGRPVIDTTDDVLNLTLSGCNGVYTSTNEASGYLLCTTSAPVPVSVQFTLNQDIQVSTNSSFPQTSVSFTILTPTALNVGDLIDIGGIYPESTRLTAVGALSGGVQTVTAPLRYGHFNRTIAFGNPNGVGMAGRFLEYPSQTAMQTAHAKMTYNVLGSPDANHIAFFTSVTGKMDPLWGGNGVVNIYHGGYVTDVRDTTGGANVDNNFHLALMDNDAPWTTGAGLEVTQEINQTWKGLAGTMDVYNPFGNGHFIDLECDPGSYACGNMNNDGATGFLYYRNANPLSFYTANTVSGGTAGVANLGRVFDIAGPVGTFAYIGSSPVKPIFEFGGSAYGISLIQIDDDQAGITFSHSDHSWSLTGQGVHLGTALSTSTNAVSVTEPTTIQGTDGPGTTSLKILPPLNGTGLALWNTGKAQTDGAALFNSSVTLAGLTTTPGGLNVTAHSCMLGADLNGNVGCNNNPISGTTFTGTRLDLQYNGSTVGQVTNNLSTFQIQSVNGSTFALAAAGQMRLSASGATGFGSGGIRFDSYLTGSDGSGLTLRSNADSGHTGSPLVLQVSDYNLNTFQTVLQSNGVTTNGAHAGISLVPNGGTVALGGDITPLHDTLASGATCGTHVANAIWADDAYIYHCNAAGTAASRAALSTY